MVRLLTTALVALLTGVLAEPAPGQEPAPSTPSTEEERLQDLEARLQEQGKRIREQDEKLRRLESRTDPIDPERLEAAVDTYLQTKRTRGDLPGFEAGWDKRPYLKSSDDEFRLEIGGNAQIDYRVFQRNSPANDTFTLREVRPYLAGWLWKNYEYKISLELTNASARLKDAFMNIHYLDEAQLKVGQFQEPFGMDRIAGRQDFHEHSLLAEQLCPERDVGAMVHGKIHGGVLDYAAGFFNGDGANTRDSNDDKDVAARLVLTPFKQDGGFWSKGFQIGGNVTHGDQNRAIAGTSFRTAGDLPFFRFGPATRSEDALTRHGADFAWLVGPASIKGEWVHEEIDDVVRGRRSEDFEVDAYYVSSTYLLTGEEKTARHIAPAAPFDPVDLTGWGAWELSGRFEYFDVDSSIIENGFATGTESVWATTAGVNWYLNSNVRVSVNYEYSRFDQDVTVDGEPIGDEHMIGIRMQFAF